MSLVDSGFVWEPSSSDPNDEQFGEIVEKAALDEAGDRAVVLVGEPTDLAVIGRRGAARGPGAIRKALAGVKTHDFERGPVVGTAANGGIADLGDVGPLVDAPRRTETGEVEGPVKGRVLTLQDSVRETTERVHELGAFPVFLGGDNSVTYPNAAPLLEAGSLAVVNFDAHLDVREVRADATSGSPYRQLFEEGLDDYVCVGARHFETSTVYHDYVRERGGSVVTADAVGADFEAAVARIRDAVSEADQVYVSVDCDVLDASAAPGVSAPTPGGLSTRELYRLLRVVVADPRVAGFEVVECAPPHDEGGRTVDAAARAVAHALSARGTGGDAGAPPDAAATGGGGA